MPAPLPRGLSGSVRELERVNVLVTSAEIVVVHVDAVTPAAQDVAGRVDETDLLARAIATRVDTL